MFWACQAFLIAAAINVPALATCHCIGCFSLVYHVRRRLFFSTLFFLLSFAISCNLTGSYGRSSAVENIDVQISAEQKMAIYLKLSDGKSAFTSYKHVE